MARNVVVRITLGVVVAQFTSMAMNARDLGQWDDPANADLKRWYQDLKQPDNPQRRVAVKPTHIGLMPLRRLRTVNTWLSSPIPVTTSR